MPYTIVFHFKDGTSSDTNLFPGSPPMPGKIVKLHVAGRTVFCEVLGTKHIKPKESVAFDLVDAQEI